MIVVGTSEIEIIVVGMSEMEMIVVGTSDIETTVVMEMDAIVADVDELLPVMLADELEAEDAELEAEDAELEKLDELEVIGPDELEVTTLDELEAVGVEELVLLKLELGTVVLEVNTPLVAVPPQTIFSDTAKGVAYTVGLAPELAAGEA